MTDDAPTLPTCPGILCYVDDALPGISRKKLTHGWAYYAPDGARITDREEIDRLNAIGMPPAYHDCWFCPSPHGHIQATGLDDKGRKQYRYHAEFRAAQDAAKYGRCGDFGRALPLVRARVDEDLTGGRLDKARVVAAIVRLLDLGHIRVGNEAYAKANKSFGATTLRDRHAAVRGATVSLRYTGKSGKEQRITIEDKRLARLVAKTQDLPGQQLFQYLDAEGGRHPVTSGDVNDYLREATGAEFTAKNFRTWGASVIAFEQLIAHAANGIKLKTLLEPVAAALGNTPAISRKSYVHPALIDLADGKPQPALADLRLPRSTRYLDRHERGLIAFLGGLADVAEAAGMAEKQAA